MIRIIKALLGAPLFVSARGKIGRGNYIGANRDLILFARILGVGAPSYGLPIRANIMLFQIGYFSKDKKLSLGAASVSIPQLLKILEVKDTDDYRYVARYLFELCEYSAGRFVESESQFLDLAFALEIETKSFDLPKVSDHLQSQMPLRSLALG